MVLHAVSADVSPHWAGVFDLQWDTVGWSTARGLSAVGSGDEAQTLTRGTRSFPGEPERWRDEHACSRVCVCTSVRMCVDTHGFVCQKEQPVLGVLTQVRKDDWAP